MAALGQFLSAQPASAIRGTGATQKPIGAGAALDGVLARIDQIEMDRGELAGEFARSFIEGQFRRRGIPLNLKSKAERELEQRQSELAARQIQDLERERAVRETVGFLLDNAGTKVGAFFPDDPEADSTFEELFGTRLDQSILQRPEDLVAVSRGLADKLGAPQFALSPSDLLLNKFTSPFAQKSQEERAAEEINRQTGAQADTERNLQFQAELQAGENLSGQAFKQRLEAAGESSDQDLDPAGFFGNDDFDTARGSAEAVRAILFHAESNKQLGPALAMGLLIGTDEGKRIASVLRAADVQVTEDGRRIARIGSGNFSNEPEAIANYFALVDLLSREKGTPRSEFFQLMGLPFDDVAPEDLSFARQQLFGQQEDE